MSKGEEFKARVMWFVCYPESVDITQAIEKVDCEQWAYCLHDKDTDENGVLKKDHYHVILKFENARNVEHIAGIFGVAANLIKVVSSRSVKDKVRYLIHLDSKDKYRYESKDIHYAGLPVQSYLCASEDEQALEVLQIVKDALDHGKPWSYVVYRCAESGLYGCLRRGSALYSGVYKFG